MRGVSRIPPRGACRLRALHADERGATLALVALSMVGLVAAAALVVDVGHGRLTRQNLLPATDAAALAAAQELVERPWDTTGACSAAAGYVTGNSPAAAMTGCDTVSLGPDGGRVEVAATENVDAFFADGDDDDGSTLSASTAAWGPPLTVSGLRPVALCYDGSLDLQRLIDEPPDGPTWVVVDFAMDDPVACGGLLALGNFLSVDFGSDTSTYEIRNWMRDGYPGQVAFDGTPASSCGGGVACYERPYALLDLTWELASLRDSRSYVAFPVYDYADLDQVHLIGFVRARLYAFDLSGLPGGWSLELKVDPGLIAGTCCGPAGIDGGNKAIALCGVDPGAHLACDPATTS